ncbi:hypothetical protein EMCRGX_G022705 [Ephydatia muelleri]
MDFSYHKRGSILLSVSIRTGNTNKSITRGHTKLVLGNRCLKALWCLNICVWCSTTFMCEEKFNNQADAK